ncbi:hypothetical protein QZH41_013150 [Actinostola sp. cb2023]|nr:hypothetical protein QZH41_013150 [Actinostola sp. cb2023]
MNLIFNWFFLSNIVNALKCYACLATDDWSKCNDVKKEETCSSSISHCLKADVSVKGDGVDTNSYLKVCSDSCDVKTLSQCNKKQEGMTIKCNISCCKGDLCNGGSLPLASSIIIVACALFYALTAL